MAQERDFFIPISWDGKQDLRNVRPKLAEQIDSLDDKAMQNIADKVGDALQETYRVALEIALLKPLGITEPPDDDFLSV
jgi:hypothetical protein